MPKNVMCKNCLNLTHHWCERVIDSPDEDLERDCPYFCQKTNADRIRAMSDDELGEFVSSLGCVDRFKRCNGSCKKCTLEWLKQPVEE